VPQLRGHFRSGRYDLRRGLQNDLRFRSTGTYDDKNYLRRDRPEERSTDFVFVVDISGSMSQGGRIAAAREATVVFMEALAQLKMKFGVVAFNGTPAVLADIDKLEDVQREAMLRRLQAGGDNNEPGALKLAREMLERSTANHKVVLFLTDGGAVANAKSYVEQTRRERPDLTIIGVGIGAGMGEVAKIYGAEHSVVVPDVEELPRQIGDLLKRQILAR
jgi:Mg-chelatase subunit ChlD